ncbi:MAG TPA: response regulator transcription factor [Chloroflexi bacterium]|nr:response regulator transcription factor [Chloroflexota bacterium]
MVEQANLPSTPVDRSGDLAGRILPGRDLSVLIAEDELVMRRLLKQSMERLGFTVVEAIDGDDALQKFSNQRFNLIMLDVLMPKRNGFEVCQEIRHRSDVPIVMITALNRPEDIIQGLEFGADNYITKPFNFKELEARIYAVIRRSTHLSNHRSFDVAEIGDLRLFNATQEAEIAGRRVTLTPIEFALLRHLASQADRPVSKEELLQEVWGYMDTNSPNLVELAVRRLRTKIEIDSANPTRVVTVRGVGYKYCSSPVHSHQRT